MAPSKKKGDKYHAPKADKNPKGATNKKGAKKTPKNAKSTRKPGEKRGRKAVQIDWTAVANLAHINCTLEEVAAFLGLDETTIERAAWRDHGCNFAAWYEPKRQFHKISLRRAQMKMAQRNATMAIWLGKQVLGQKDKQEVSGPDGGPMQHQVESLEAAEQETGCTLDRADQILRETIRQEERERLKREQQDSDGS